MLLEARVYCSIACHAFGDENPAGTLVDTANDVERSVALRV